MDAVCLKVQAVNSPIRVKWPSVHRPPVYGLATRRRVTPVDTINKQS